MSSAGRCESAEITSAANGLLMMRPVMPALAQTSLLEVEIGHLVVGDRRQAAIIRHRVLAGRCPPHRLGDAEGIIPRTLRAMGVDIDDGHQMPGLRPPPSSAGSFIISESGGRKQTVCTSAFWAVSFIATTGSEPGSAIPTLSDRAYFDLRSCSLRECNKVFLNLPIASCVCA